MPNESRLRCGALKKKGSFNILALRCASKWPRRQHQRDRSACPRRDELPGALGTGPGDDALARDGGEVALEAEGAASRHLRRWAVAALGARARLALGSVARRPSPLREVHCRSEVYVYGGSFFYPWAQRSGSVKTVSTRQLQALVRRHPCFGSICRYPIAAKRVGSAARTTNRPPCPI